MVLHQCNKEKEIQEIQDALDHQRAYDLHTAEEMGQVKGTLTVLLTYQKVILGLIITLLLAVAKDWITKAL